MRTGFARSSFGLEIDDRMLKLVQLVPDRNRTFRIKKQELVKLPDQTIEDGKLLEPDIVVEQLTEMAGKVHAAGKRVHLLVPGAVVMARYMQLPDLPLKKLRKVLEFELGDSIRLPFDDPYYDFVKLPGRAQEAPAEEGGGPMCDILLVAASSSVIKQYVGLVAQAGMKPVSIEIKGLALYRLLDYMSIRSHKGVLLAVDMSMTSAELCLYKSGSLRMSRNVSLDVAGGERMPGPTGFGNYGSLGTIAQVAAAGQSDPLEEQCEHLAQEIERFVAFYRYTWNQRDEMIEGIVLCGDMEQPMEVAEWLRERLPYPLQLVGSNGEMQSRLRSFPLTPQNAVAFGLALRGFKR